MPDPTTRDAIRAKVREQLAQPLNREGYPIAEPVDPAPADPVDADESTAPRPPAPDPSQGGRGGLPVAKTNAQLIHEIRNAVRSY
ncbi:hypothetical protein ACLQ3H_00345 [Micromonospora saelicesensis]|uniref:hypothetical protein n=1 Tax=Micromonospora saelicesensis TaxID=285676 RepID=UPI003CEDE0D1